MDDINKIQDLIREKTKLFITYEAISLNMQPDETEKLEVDLAKRQELAQQINAIDEAIHSLCHGQGLWLQAVQNSCNRDVLSPNLQAVFDDAQELYIVINRIIREEERISQEMEQIRLDLIEQIKSNQQVGKIVKYRNALEPSLEAGSLLNTKHRKA